MLSDCDDEYQRRLAAWQRASMIKGINPDFHRKTLSGRVIRWPDFENKRSPTGWKIRLIDPNGRDPRELSNVEAIHIGDG